MITIEVVDLYKSIQAVCITKIQLQLIACSKLRQCFAGHCMVHPNVIADNIKLSHFHELTTRKECQGIGKTPLYMAAPYYMTGQLVEIR